MLLSDQDIIYHIEVGKIDISPYESDNLQPSSYDFRLSNQFRILQDNGVIDTRQGCETRLIELPDTGSYVIPPLGFVLGCTLEEFRFGDEIAGRVEGKSSLGRLGLQAHATAGFVDPGFHGQITLELSNVTDLPLRVWPGQLIGQMCFMRLSSKVMRPYGSTALRSRYQGQRGPTESRIGIDTPRGNR